MKRIKYKIPCQHCGEIQEKSNNIKITTCIGCKAEIQRRRARQRKMEASGKKVREQVDKLGNFIAVKKEFIHR